MKALSTTSVIFIVWVVAACTPPKATSPQKKKEAIDYVVVNDRPTQRPPQIYGRYGAGCLDGAKTLPVSGEGYEFVKLERKRYYGHPELLDFLQKFAKRVKAQGHGRLLFADLAQARGGPMPSGHASHQVGLDADVYFERRPQESPLLTLDQGNQLEAASMLNQEMREMSELWSEAEAEVLELAAQDSRVQRIFVNHVIKRKLCELHQGENWLGKVRPWWGHHYHFHVRLSCPPDNPHCLAQAPPPAGDGCDASLDWWYSEEAKKKLTEQSSGRLLPQLPRQCREVFRRRE